MMMAHPHSEDLDVTKWQGLRSVFRDYLAWSHWAICALIWAAIAILAVGSHLLKLNLPIANGVQRFLNTSCVPRDWMSTFWLCNRNRRQ